MNLRLVLPPNLAARAERDAIPTKLELDTGAGKPLPPEKVDPSEFGELPDAQRVAAFALTQWCGGAVASFLQLTKSQLSELIQMLPDEDCFFFVNNPETPIPWEDGGLAEVSVHLDLGEEKETHASPEASESLETSKEVDSFEPYHGPPISVEGSTNFLLITLPSEDHPRYLEALRLLRKWNFVHDRRNENWWWLRDRRKTFDFLAHHRFELEEYYQAEFTENFLQHFKKVREARMQTTVSESGTPSEVTMSIEAEGVPQSEIDHALAIGQNFLEAEGKVYLLPKEKLEKFHLLQRQLSGNPRAPLLHHGTFPVSKEGSLETEEMIAEFELIKPTLIMGRYAQLSASYEQNHVILDDGRFTTRIWSGNLDFSFSPDLSWKNLVQYDSESKNLGGQSRIRWILEPGQELFLVGLFGWQKADHYSPFLPTNQEVALKLLYTLRF